MSRFVRTVLAASMLALIVAVPATAQAPGLDIKLNPRIGLYVPLTELSEFDQAGETITQELEGSLAVGLGIELGLGMLPFGIRANIDYATGSEITLTDEDGVEVEEGVETTLLAVVGDLVFRPLPRLVLFQPYLFAGGGLKQYGFEADEGAVQEFEDESDPTVHIGGGLDLGLGPLDLNAEVGDYISWYELADEPDSESEMQHDLFVTIGFSIGML